ncbi:MAG: phosphoglycerate mutase family protein [Eubacterium sp.]|nr:phosphoglycerate mutase family protein [Eubacterium sp.]
MTTFYFVRHGEMDTSMAGAKFYKGFSYNMMTLSEKGIGQIKETAKDSRLANAELIISSPFGRTLHSAAILSKELNVDMKVETDLHEWLADGVTYEFLSDEEAAAAYQCLNKNAGQHPEKENCRWESAEQMKKRVMKVLNKYKDFNSVIVVCHGTLMQYVLGIPHPENGQIEVLSY